MKRAPICVAIHLLNRVLPLPGAPKSSTRVGLSTSNTGARSVGVAKGSTTEHINQSIIAEYDGTGGTGAGASSVVAYSYLAAYPPPRNFFA